MTAEEKFDARIKELGIWDRWCSIGQIGRIGAETEDNIIVLVHESDDDAYSEFTFPTMQTMQEHEDFRDSALAEFVDAGDEKFIRELVWWWISPTNKCPLYPEDVYFIWAEHTCKDFEDDIEAEQVEKEAIDTRKWEYRTYLISTQPAEELNSMRRLEKMGQEGWEMMCCQEAGYRLLKAIFKREIK